MKKEFIIIGIIVLIIVLGVVIFFVTRKADTDSKKIEITIKSTAGIPYKWVCEIEDESVVELVDKYDLKQKNVELVEGGGPVYTNYVFKGLKKGKTKVHFKYINIDNENDIYEEETDILKVDDNLNISLVLMEE